MPYVSMPPIPLVFENCLVVAFFDGARLDQHRLGSGPSTSWLSRVETALLKRYLKQ